MNGPETRGRTYEQPCPDCGGYLVEVGEGARCIDCDTIHAPCHDEDCLGFLDTKGWNGPKAVLQCDECMATVQLFDRFGPSASTSERPDETPARHRNPPRFYGVEGVPGIEGENE